MDTEVVEKASLNVVRVDVKVNGEWGNGSGLLIDENGTVLTCDHVIHPNGLHPENISVAKQNELSKTAEIIAFDQHHDLAVIRVRDFKINGTLNIKKHVNYNEIKVGQDSFVLGYPIGLQHLTLTRATISAKGKGLVNRFQFEVVQIDARVNRGNSGGPLFNDKGEVVGIVTMKYIPFLDKIEELRRYVNSIPKYSSYSLKIPYINISITDFIDNVHDATRRMTQALDIVQVGIGWVIPIHFSSGLLAK
jgi:S1-C subfamily serine protease